MEPMTLRDIAAALDATVASSENPLVEGVCTDTRSECRGRVFFALRGERTDGHLYVRQAEENGAVGVVVDHPVGATKLPQLVVPDTLKALGDLARAYIGRLLAVRVAVTGSVGKTTVRSMVAAVLSARYTVCESARNHNNEIGLPLTILNVERQHTAAVLEMAMRGKGQIAYLASIARPEIGVITNVGVSHMELLGSQDAIADAKAELFDALPDGGVAILPADDAYRTFLCMRASAGPGRRVITFGVAGDADFRCHGAVISAKAQTEFAVNGVPFVVQAPGLHLAVDASAACAVGYALGITLEEASHQLRSWVQPEQRMTVRQTPRGPIVLDDTYNAAPDSVRAALRTLVSMASSGGRRAVAVLGDMRELGDYADDAHAALGRLPEMEAVAALVTVGEDARRIAETAPVTTKHACSTTDEAAQVLDELLEAGDIVLVKGSRAMAMEKIVRALVDSD